MDSLEAVSKRRVVSHKALPNLERRVGGLTSTLPRIAAQKTTAGPVWDFCARLFDRALFRRCSLANKVSFPSSFLERCNLCRPAAALAHPCRSLAINNPLGRSDSRRGRRMSVGQTRGRLQAKRGARLLYSLRPSFNRAVAQGCALPGTGAFPASRPAIMPGIQSHTELLTSHGYCTFSLASAATDRSITGSVSQLTTLSAVYGISFNFSVHLFKMSHQLTPTDWRSGPLVVAWYQLA